MRKKKNNKRIGLLIIVLIIILILLIVFSGNKKTDTKLNLSEKKWIENNKKELINVSIANDIPIFSSEGNGVFFDFVSYLEDETGLKFNLISYDTEVQENDIYFEVLNNKKSNKLDNKDMVFYTDYYVLIGKDGTKISSFENLRDKSIGSLSSTLSDISFYLTNDNGIKYISYEKESDLKTAFDNSKVDYIAVPKTRFYSYILSNSYHIVYNITELKETYVLNTLSDDEELSSIVNKMYINYKNNKLEKDYNDSLLTFIMDKSSVTDKSRADFLGKKYTFGYLENKPYTYFINNKLIGLDSTYINSFINVTNSSFIYKKYRSVRELSNALNSGYVDIASNYYNYSGLNDNYSKTMSVYDEEYVVLVNKNRTDVVVNSVNSLNGKNVIAINSTLAKYLKSKDIKVNSYDRINDLVDNIKDDSIIVLDKNLYELYKDSDLDKFRVIYSDRHDLNYGFIIRKSGNETFEKIFTRYIEFINHKQVNNLAWKEYDLSNKEVSYVYLYIIGGIIVVIILWLLTRKKIKVIKKGKREETIRYIDPLTSLKNRNYLNKNFRIWENNAIYPQAIVVINLNNLRHVNDVYGHEEGDKLIKLAANILIKNQLDQSDIIRTDGNEYLIYMVGYEKNKVLAYMRKLFKELSDLPYGYGATLGYSMIEDDIKTIDDAINEAVLEIRANKEMNNKKK